MPKEGKEGTKEPHRQGHLSRQKNQGMQESVRGEKYWKEQQDQRQRREERKQGEQDILPTLVLHLHNITYAFSSICRALKRIQRDFPGRCIILQTIHSVTREPVFFLTGASAKRTASGIAMRTA